jgi:uncharacterized RDD family membrane protein YckC
MYIFIIAFWDNFIHSHPKNFLFVVLCIQFLPFILYFFISEFIFTTTVGKKIMKLKIEYSGNKFFVFLIRTISRLIPLDLISFFLLKDDKLLHDYISKTRVVLKNTPAPSISQKF